jgi:hypothetical protein
MRYLYLVTDVKLMPLFASYRERSGKPHPDHTALVLYSSPLRMAVSR